MTVQRRCNGGLTLVESSHPVKERDVEGFTLVELLIVIAIIALMIAILFPSLNNARRQAKVVVCASNLHQLDFAFRMYVESNSGYLSPNTNNWPTPLRPYYDKPPHTNPIDWIN